ncbi:MAG TPA: hypothetical protein VN947_15160 [Polyangia bacterium]|nr:hypothetical protein [Polyangia bacterium]
MRPSLKRLMLGCGILSYVVANAGAGRAIAPDLGKINDGRSWRILNGDAALAREAGHSVARLRPRGDIAVGSNVALALVAGGELPRNRVQRRRRKNLRSRLFSSVQLHARGRKRRAAVSHARGAVRRLAPSPIRPAGSTRAPR